MLTEILDDGMPKSLMKILDADWMMVLSRNLAPTGLMDADIVVSMDRIIDLPENERPQAFKRFMEGLMKRASAEGGKARLMNEDEEVYTFE